MRDTIGVQSAWDIGYWRSPAQRPYALPASVDTGRTSHNAHISHTSAHVTTGKLHIATLLLDPGRRSMTTAHCLPDAAVEAPHEPASPANNEMIMSVR